jgi:UDP-N-acetylmuramoylalanine--D-glutamate ligase
MFSKRRVTVMGLGHFGGGVAVARWLARQGAVVTVTDRAEGARLADSLAALRDEPIAAFHLGGHCEADFRQTDLLVVNPAVHPDSPWLALAKDAGVPVTSEMELFLQACRGRIVGVTGSNGKSTTAAMTAAVLKSGGLRTWLGGNIGESLLEKLDEIRPTDRVVLELSSFQLWYLSAAARFPDVAVVTNCVPNHLDWHRDFGHYRAAKQRILIGQRLTNLAVLNLSDPEVARWSSLVRGRLLPPWPDERIPPLRVPGEHNRRCAALAAAVAEDAGCAEEAIAAGLASYRGLPQRLELFAVAGGRYFVNDSAATTPESTLAALTTLDGPTWLLAGGSSKGSDFTALIAAVAQRAHGVAFYGSVAETLHRQLAAVAPRLPCLITLQLADALHWCWNQSRPGDTILLSPGCASLDQFTNYRQRGETFVGLVRKLVQSTDRPGLS